MDQPIIKKSDHLMGIKVWAQWFPAPRVPRFELFIYAGSQPDLGLHWFYSKRNPNLLISKNLYQLNTLGFHAFVLDIKRIEEYCESRGFLKPWEE